MKILICGDRNWTNLEKIQNELNKYNPKEDYIITGGANGADKIAYLLASKMKFTRVTIDANWEVYGKAAGPIRNRQMLDLKPDKVIAFHSDINKSRGTADCVNEAKRRGIDVEVIK